MNVYTNLCIQCKNKKILPHQRHPTHVKRWCHWLHRGKELCCRAACKSTWCRPPLQPPTSIGMDSRLCIPPSPSLQLGYQLPEMFPRLANFTKVSSTRAWSWWNCLEGQSIIPDVTFRDFQIGIYLYISMNNWQILQIWCFSDATQ